MAYTTIDNPELYFQTKLYTGTGNSHSVTLDGSENMQPDWVWLKKRSGSENHILTDSVRGATKTIRSNTTDAENTESEYLKSFDSDGFTLGTRSEPNGSGATFASWNWKKSATAGFDIVAYTGTGSSNAVSHSLSATPSMIIIKNRDDADSWYVWHQGLGAVASNYITLDTTGAKSSVSDGITAISSSNFTVNTRGDVNENNMKYIAYCFADIQGYSKVSGSYTGNGNADGPFIHTGFRPAFVIAKNVSATGGWLLVDNKRDSENVVDKKIFANLSNAEGTADVCDFLSNGFKIRTNDTSQNGSGNTIIYMAFAESPFTNSNGVPNNAR
jgi:hypothetical protein